MMFRMNPSKRGRTRAAIFAPLVFAAFTFPGAILAAPSLGDFVWDDTNANGLQDAGEPGIAGVFVSLEDCGGRGMATAITGANGRFLFDGLAEGRYQLRFQAPDGLVFTLLRVGPGGQDSDADPATGLTRCINLAAGQNKRGIDAGLVAEPAPDRFVDNGDGTITDNQTGLMWEQKLADTDALCLDADQANRDVRCVQNTYDWSRQSPTPNGTLYEDFLATLNLDATDQPLVALCFASHCDWRAPKIFELLSILDLSVLGCGTGIPCIDPIFGPTAAASYWSQTSAFHVRFSDGAWTVDFRDGQVPEFGTGKDGTAHARGVRNSR